MSSSQPLFRSQSTCRSNSWATGRSPADSTVDASREARPGFSNTNLTEAQNALPLKTIALAWLLQ